MSSDDEHQAVLNAENQSNRVEDPDEERQLRARLLARKAELQREIEQNLVEMQTIKPIERERHHHHHHKKKKKRKVSRSTSQEKQVPSTAADSKTTTTDKNKKDSMMQSVVEAKIAERLSGLSASESGHTETTQVVAVAVSASSSKRVVTVVNASNNYDEDVEMLGPNIQPPQVAAVSMSKKHKKRDRDREKRREEVKSRNSPPAAKKRREEDEKSSKQKFSASEIESSRHKADDFKEKMFSSRSAVPKTYSEMDLRHTKRELGRARLELDNRKRQRYDDKYEKEAKKQRDIFAKRGHDSRSPPMDRRLDATSTVFAHRNDHRRHVVSPPTATMDKYARRRSPAEARWLPKVTPSNVKSLYSGPPPGVDRRYGYPKQRSRVDDRDHGSRDRPSRRRGDVQQPSADNRDRRASRSPASKPVVTTASAVAQPSGQLQPTQPQSVGDVHKRQASATPTQDERGAGEHANDAVPISDSSSSSSSSSSSRENSPGKDSLESGEQRSDSEHKTYAVKQKYSKFESSPESSTSSDIGDEGEDSNGDEDVVKASLEIAVEQVEIEEHFPTPEQDNAIEMADGDANHVKEENEKESDDEDLHLPVYCPAIMGCRSVEEFQNMNKIEEGTYGVVYRAIEKRTGQIVALKRLKMEKEKEGFPITSLREINMLLKAGQHPNIVKVREIVVGSNMDKIYLVMDYVEHDLKSLMETMSQQNQHFLAGEVKTLVIQLLKGVEYLHDNWILHRDLKTSNLLLSHKGVLQIGDFGLAREYGSPLKSYTSVVVTLWYRAPELLLGTNLYSIPIDMWSVGCILAELLTLKPFFTGKSEVEQLNRIFKVLGTPNNKIWEGYDELPGVKKMSFVEYPFNSLRKQFSPATLTDKGFTLLNKLLTYDPAKRITAAEALSDEIGWLKEEPRPVPPDMFPTWPAKSERASTVGTIRGPPRVARAAAAAVRKPPEAESPPAAKVDADGCADDGKRQANTEKELLSGLKIKTGLGKPATGFSLKFDPHFR